MDSATHFLYEKKTRYRNASNHLRGGATITLAEGAASNKDIRISKFLKLLVPNSSSNKDVFDLYFHSILCSAQGADLGGQR